MESREEPLVGRRLDDRYDVEGLVGVGAMGRVCRARHAFMPRTLAVKIMYGDLAVDEDLRKRFRREALAASRIEHPNVVSVFDVGATQGGIPFMVMEYLHGKTLREWVEEGGPISELEAAWVATSVARALAQIHRRGVVHRDLKPDNIFLAEVGGRRVVKVVDFGVAVLEGETRLTRTGHIVGTPRYMSPEQVIGGDIDGRSDVFSLGLCLHFALTGRAPYGSPGPEVLREIVARPPPALREILPRRTISPQLDEIVARMTSTDREERFSSTERLLAALEPLHRGGILEEASSNVQLTTSSGPRWSRAAACLAVGGLVGYFAAQSLHPGKEAPPPPATVSREPPSLDAAQSVKVETIARPARTGPSTLGDPRSAPGAGRGPELREPGARSAVPPGGHRR